MSNQSEFHVHAAPRKLRLKKLFGKRSLTALFTGGIINPFGPTLKALAIEGKIASGSKLPIIYFSLNPFSQTVSEVGSVEVGDTWNLDQGMRQFFCLPFGSCPTLLLPSPLIELEDIITLYASFLATFDDGRSVLKKVRQFPGDPWKRVSQEVREMGSVIQDRQTGEGSETRQPRLNKEEARELAENLTSPDNCLVELKAFLEAWKGSILFQKDGPMAKGAMSDLSLHKNFFSVFRLYDGEG